MLVAVYESRSWGLSTHDGGHSNTTNFLFTFMCPEVHGDSVKMRLLRFNRIGGYETPRENWVLNSNWFFGQAAVVCSPLKTQNLGALRNPTYEPYKLEITIARMCLLVSTNAPHSNSRTFLFRKIFCFHISAPRRHILSTQPSIQFCFKPTHLELVD